MKRFAKESRKQGCFHVVGAPNAAAAPQKIAVSPVAVKNRLKGMRCHREMKGAGGVPFDKGSGTAVPPSAWVSVTFVSVLLLFAVGTLGFSLQEKKQADRAASRKGPVLRIAWNSDGMILASASSVVSLN